MDNAAFEACRLALDEALGGGDAEVGGASADEDSGSEFSAELWAGRAVLTVTLRSDLSFEIEARDIAYGGVILHQSIEGVTPEQLRACISSAVVAVGGAPRR